MDGHFGKILINKAMGIPSDSDSREWLTEKYQLDKKLKTENHFKNKKRKCIICGKKLKNIPPTCSKKCSKIYFEKTK